MSAAFVGSVFLILTVAYIFPRSSSSQYPQYKRQVLRRRAWFLEEQTRRSTDDEATEGLGLRTWHNPTLVISRVVKLSAGLSLEFENDPPLRQRKYSGKALLRMGKRNEAEVVAEIMEPKPSKDNPVLRVWIGGAEESVAKPGDSFWFLTDPKLR